MNWSPSPQTQELARLRHAERIRDATRRYALLHPDDRPVERGRVQRNTLARVFARLSPAA